MTKRALPVLAPIEPRQLRRFDARESSPLALAVLRKRLGTWRFIKTLIGFAWRGAFADPTRALDKPHERDEILTRIQLRPVLLLEDAMTQEGGRSREEAVSILREVMRTSGSAFMVRFWPDLDADDWRGASDGARFDFVTGLVSRIFNASVQGQRADAESISFDVTRCRFVDALRRLDRMHLGPLFCEVDAAFVERPGSKLVLERTGTLATGATRCDFRFSMK